jgi:riboflavin synthase
MVLGGMFSGIVEALQSIKIAQRSSDLIRVEVARPKDFGDVRIGDSIATNGICLTVESLSPESLGFAIGAETLKVLKTSPDSAHTCIFFSSPVNLERSLRLGDRIHGHLVSGHVDEVGEVTKSQAQGECWSLEVKMSKRAAVFVWKKGSLCLNGVSLTINEVQMNANDVRADVLLIPETIKRTNLAQLKPGQSINIEWDWMAKGLWNQQQALKLGTTI